MKYSLLCIMFFCLFTSGCANNTDFVSGLTKLSAIQAQSQLISEDLKIVNSNVSIKPGGFGFITIQGRPETKYKITTSFRKRNRLVNVTQWRVTGTDGRATFNWVVDPETAPGTYSAVISGGGKRLDTYHTVLFE